MSEGNGDGQGRLKVDNAREGSAYCVSEITASRTIAITVISCKSTRENFENELFDK